MGLPIWPFHSKNSRVVVLFNALAPRNFIWQLSLFWPPENGMKIFYLKLDMILKTGLGVGEGGLRTFICLFSLLTRPSKAVLIRNKPISHKICFHLICIAV